MKATPFEFHLRYLIHTILYVLGFWAPWNYLFHWDTIRTWQLLAAWPARSGWLSFSASTIAVLLLGTLCVFAAALLRTWASACLGAAIVQDGNLHGEALVAAGPFRHLRNPLYLGTFLHTLGLALLMPPTGAVFCIVAIALLQLRLIAAEESFLTRKLGDPYLAYCAKVPGLLPAFTSQVPASTSKPRWLTAFLGETYFWGVAIAFATLGWRYNSVLILKGVLISFGISLIGRAFIPKQ